MFQSSPPEFGGRVPCVLLHSWPRKCFNPRPPNSGGASASGFHSCEYPLVSILAPRIRGARPGFKLLNLVVNAFQSSPPEFGGRVRPGSFRVWPKNSFNPRPPNSGGASGAQPGDPRRPAVSILAPRIRGARRRFAALLDPVGEVSILAPRIRGARHGRHGPEIALSWFQSSPPEFGGRVEIWAAAVKGLNEFQSSPPEFGGRVQCARNQGRRHPCFNPRPPNSGGASRRRRCGRSRAPCFNPRPPNSGGASPRGNSRPGWRARFNPRPPNSGGASGLGCNSDIAWNVSILAPRIRGARQAAMSAAMALSGFQSSPPEFGGRVQQFKCYAARK